MQTQATSNETPQLGRASFSLFLALSCVYILLARGRITSGDEWHVYGTTESLVERGSWRVEVAGFTRTYSRFSVLPSVLGVPFYKLAQPVAQQRGDDLPPGDQPPGAAASSGSPRGLSRRDLLQAAVSLQTPFLTAATAVVLLWGLVRLGVGGGPALAASLTFALGTLALPYSGSMYTQPMAALGVVCVLVSTALGMRVRAGASLAFLLAVRLEFLVLLPVLWLHEWLLQRRKVFGQPSLLAGAVLGVGINVAVNVLRGDHPIAGDYGSEGFTTPIGIGMHGLFFSSGKGLLWFAPAAAAGVLLLPWLWREVPRIGLLAGGFAGALLIVAACWWTWHGARSWGPRLLVPLMPVLVLPLAWRFQNWQLAGTGWRWLLMLVLLASTAIQFWGALRDPVSEGVLIGPPVAANENESIYIPHTGPWGVASQQFPDLLLWRLWVHEPAWRNVLVAVVIVLLAVAGLSAWQACRAVAVPAGWLRIVVPPVQTPVLATLGAAIGLVVLPELLIAALIAGGGSHRNESASDAPQQFNRLTARASRKRLSGQLFVPLSGDYIFYQQGPQAADLSLDGQPTFGGGTRSRFPATVELKAGFHRIDVQTESPGEFNALYWTTPGLAHYKEPVSRLYLTGPSPSRGDRAAIALAHWKWLAWLTALLGLLAVVANDSLNRRRTATDR